jgi:hypothetical protein
MRYKYTMEYCSAIKEHNPAICDNREWTKDPYIQWNKSGTQLWVLCDLILCGI